MAKKKTKALIIIVIVICVLVLVLIQRRPLKESEVLGTYIAKDKETVHHLEIKSNGKYICNYVDPNRQFTSSGNWELEVRGKNLEITFDRIRISYPYGNSNRPITRMCRVERAFWGGIRMPLYRDVGFYFIKEK